jgi:glutathione S-transferase
MKLYSNPVSPFGTRATIAIRAKGIQVETVVKQAPELKTPDYLKMNPLGKLPVLQTDKGTVVAESEAILNYLEDRFPKPSLRPADPDERARMNVAIRAAETYVVLPATRLFGFIDPASRDQKAIAAEAERMKTGLAVLAHFMSKPLPEAEAGVSFADCMLAPSLQLLGGMCHLFGLGDLTKPHDVISSYYARVSKHPVIGKALDELNAAQAAYAH